jgi:hypothetical protein
MQKPRKTTKAKHQFSLRLQKHGRQTGNKNKNKNKIERKTGNYLPYLRYHPQMFSPSAH